MLDVLHLIIACSLKVPSPPHLLDYSAIYRREKTSIDFFIATAIS